MSLALGNPYLRLLYEHLAREGFAVVERPRLTARWLVRNRGRVAFLHFHWPEGLYRAGRGPVALRGLLSWAKLGLLAIRILAARVCGYRIVWTIHQLYPHERDGRGRDRLGSLLLGWSSSLLIAHEHATAARARTELPGAARRVAVIPHGSYVGVYPRGRERAAIRRELGLPGDAFVFLCFGELRQYKGIELVLAAFAALPAPAVRLVIAGHAKDAEVAAAVRRGAAADPRVVPRLGFVAEQRVAELYGACDAAVVSRRDGGTSGSLLLAASLGVPVVAADLPAYREVLGDDAGWYFAAGDPGSLAAALAEAASAPDAAARGRNALAIAEGRSWAAIAAATAVRLRALSPDS